ncbi:MAG: hypothetical protein ACE5E5_06200 [Phycisphaerae bacterium]
MVKIPFVGRLFWKILPAVFVLVVLTFWIAVRFFDYEMTNADYGGSFISGIIFSYLLHLWMLPADAYPDYEDDYEDDDEWEDEEDDDDDENTSETASDSTVRKGAPSSP